MWMRTERYPDSSDAKQITADAFRICGYLLKDFNEVSDKIFRRELSTVYLLLAGRANEVIRVDSAVKAYLLAA